MYNENENETLNVEEYFEDLFEVVDDEAYDSHICTHNC